MSINRRDISDGVSDISNVLDLSSYLTKALAGVEIANSLNRAYDLPSVQNVVPQYGSMLQDGDFGFIAKRQRRERL